MKKYLSRFLLAFWLIAALPVPIHATPSVQLATRWENAMTRIAAAQSQPPTLADDFSRDQSNWSPFFRTPPEDGDTFDPYAEGMVWLDDSYVGLAADEIIADDFYVEVDAILPTIEAENSRAFLFFRLVDAENFYGYVVEHGQNFASLAPDGEPAYSLMLFKLIQGDFTPLAQVLIDPPAQDGYRLGLVADGTQLSLLVNGELILVTQDNSFSTGQIVLAGETDEDVSIAFDNFKLWQFETGAATTAASAVARDRATPRATRATPRTTSTPTPSSAPSVTPIVVQADGAAHLLELLDSEQTGLFQLDAPCTFTEAYGSQAASMTDFTPPGGSSAVTSLTPDQAVVDNITEMLARTYFRVQTGRVLADTPTSAGVSAVTVSSVEDRVSLAYDYFNQQESGTIEIHFRGDLTGDEMQVSYQAGSITAGVVMGVGQGMSAYMTAEFTCLVTWLPASQWPPLPPQDVQAVELDNRGIRITWAAREDAVAYRLYRTDVFADQETLVAELPGEMTSYEDLASAVTTNTGFVSYYLVAVSENGMVSNASTWVNLNLLHRMWEFPSGN